MQLPAPPADGLKPAEIRAALDHLVASVSLATSPRLVSFLRFVVETTLAGHGHRIKGYTIGVEALGRNASFDPQTDPIVRVEAGRLRRALARYYAKEGNDDAVTIELQPGSYVPVFRGRSARTDSALPAAQAQILRSRLQPPSIARTTFVKRAAACALGAVLIAAISLLLPSSIQSVPKSMRMTGGAATPALASPRSLSALPIILVEPFEAFGPVSNPAISAGDIRRRMRDALARFDEIRVVAEVLIDPTTPNSTAQRKGYPARIDYRVSGMLEYHGDETVSPTFRLIDASTGTIVWTRTFERVRLDRNPSAYQEALVYRTVMTIAQANGVIQARERVKGLFGAAIDPRYGCLLDHNAYRQSYNPGDYEHVRACLTRAIADDPSFALGFALLGRLQVRRHVYRLGNANGDLKPLDQGLRLAHRAAELDPQSATAHLSLMIIHFARGEVDAAWAAAEKAIMLNPYDMHIRADYGFARLRYGQIEQATALLREAVERLADDLNAIGLGVTD